LFHQAFQNIPSAECCVGFFFEPPLNLPFPSDDPSYCLWTALPPSFIPLSFYPTFPPFFLIHKSRSFLIDLPFSFPETEFCPPLLPIGFFSFFFPPPPHTFVNGLSLCPFFLRRGQIRFFVSLYGFPPSDRSRFHLPGTISPFSPPHPALLFFLLSFPLASCAKSL